MEGNDQIEDTMKETNACNEETSASSSEPHLPQDDFRKENDNTDGFDENSDARSNLHDESAAPASGGSPFLDDSEILGLENGGSSETVEDDDGSGSDNGENDISELIRLASAAAVRDATRMKKSDSDLSESSNGNDDDDILDELLEEDIFVRQQQQQQQQQQDVYHAPPQMSMSSEYMEQASYEASLVENSTNDGSPGRTQLKPSGPMGRMAHRTSSLGIIDVDGMEEEDATDSVTESGRRSSQRSFRDSLRPSEFETFHSLKSLSNINVLEESNDKSDGEHKNNDTKPDSPAAEASSIDGLLTELLSKCGINAKIYDDFKEIDRQILLLHALFNGFCRPPLQMYTVRKIVEAEQRRMHDEDNEIRVQLPLGVVVQRPSDVLLNLLTNRLPSSNALYLEMLPPVFVSSLFRILLRLLEGYTDAQYDSCVILASCPWQNEVPGRERTKTKQAALQNQSSVGVAAKTSAPLGEKLFVGITNDATANANLMYSIARLRMKWQNAVKSTLDSLVPILNHAHDKSYLLFPMIRLTGVLCAGGVAVNELRQMISIASDYKLPVQVKLLMTKALSVAASAASPATIAPRTATSALVVLGKANPRNFFSFASGPGITRTIHFDDQQQASWPFRNDFGAAFNFRVEDFSCPPNKDEKNFILLQALSETGNGIELSLVPLPPQGKAQSTVAVLTIKTMENHKTVECIKVNNCPLHARVWYHVAVRHTRSRLKGMFSLSSREQLYVLLDGKLMLNEAMKFPQIKPNYNVKQTLSFHVGKNLDGQLGSIYIFRDNVSDTTLKALYELTSSESTTATTNVEKTAGNKKSAEIADQSHQPNESMKMHKRNIQRDDLEHIVFDYHRQSSVEEGNMARDIADLHDNEEKSDAKKPLSKASFSSRLYISWNPCRKEKNFLMELHSGAHASLDQDFVQAVCIDNAQEVIASIGGTQALLPVLQSMLGGKSLQSAENNDEISTFSLIPDLLLLLSCFVRGNYQNARELLRCGGIDIVEQLLLENKTKCMASTTYKRFSMIRSLFVLPTLSKLLVQTLLEFRSSCSHCTALEKRFYSGLLFNVPLWLEWRGRNRGVSLHRFLLPTLSYIVKDGPAKFCDCVGATSIVSYVRDVVEVNVKSSNDKKKLTDLFHRDPNEMEGLILLTSRERDYIINTLLAWLFQIFLAQPSRDDISALIHLLSNYLGAFSIPFVHIQSCVDTSVLSMYSLFVFFTLKSMVLRVRVE